MNTSRACEQRQFRRFTSPATALVNSTDTSCSSTPTTRESHLACGPCMKRRSHDLAGFPPSSNGIRIFPRSKSSSRKHTKPIVWQEKPLLSLRDLQLRFAAALFEGSDAIVSPQ